jgi:tetratricopeptide (TPR) repeat protein
VLLILGYLAYQKYIKAPMEKEAADELAFPKAYFEDAMSNSVAADSLFTLSLNGADGKYGFVDIASEYKRTKAGNLANYYAGIAYLQLNMYVEAIDHLEKFSSSDELLGPTAKGAIGDAFADINQPEDAMEYYLEAADLKINNFSTPLFLFKAGNTALEIGEFKKALGIFERIRDEFPDSREAEDIDIYINKAAYGE